MALADLLAGILDNIVAHINSAKNILAITNTADISVWFSNWCIGRFTYFAHIILNIVQGGILQLSQKLLSFVWNSPLEPVEDTSKL